MNILLLPNSIYYVFNRNGHEIRAVSRDRLAWRQAPIAPCKEMTQVGASWNRYKVCYPWETCRETCKSWWCTSCFTRICLCLRNEASTIVVGERAKFIGFMSTLSKLSRAFHTRDYTPQPFSCKLQNSQLLTYCSKTGKKWSTYSEIVKMQIIQEKRTKLVAHNSICSYESSYGL